MKRLSVSKQVELEEQNKARELNGLPLLKVSVRTCKGCGLKYEALDSFSYCQDCDTYANKLKKNRFY